MRSLDQRDTTWPALPYDRWKDTCATLQLWTQIVGKVRLAQSPWLNHSWHVPLYVTARGLTSAVIPHGETVFDLEFDFVDHELVLRTSRGVTQRVALRPQSVADFHAEVMRMLVDAGVPVRIHQVPSEIPDAIRFDEDHLHAAYDAEYAARFWRVLVATDRVFRHFRTAFLGKSSPVHFFWGSFDLAVTRFSGRPAPPHRGGVPNLPDAVVREAYSHEVSSAGFWPGGAGIDYPAFYAYAYPEPAGFRRATVRPAAAFFSESLGEFLLPYEAVRTAADPEQTLFAFLQSTYEVAADAGHWDRAALDCAPGQPQVPRDVR